jgi:hypothetical protein
MRAAQTSTVDKHAALFEQCDIFIDTDDDAWTFIVANPKARAVVDALIDTPINWNFGTPLQEWWTCAPSDWRAVDLNFRQLKQEGRLTRLPKLGNVGTDTHPFTLQVAIAAKTAGLRVVTHDDKTGWQTVDLQVENNVIDFASAREAITRHRAKSHSYGETQSLQFDVSSKLIDQKVRLPGLPGGPPLVPSLPMVSFENGHLSGGADVLERIVRNDKAEVVRMNVGRKPAMTFPSHIHQFELSANVCGTMSREDRKQMLADMNAAGLLHLPYDEIAVRFYLSDICPTHIRAHVTFAVSGALSVPERFGGNLVAAENIADTVAITFLDGRPPIIQSITELTGMRGKDASIEMWQVKGELVTTCLEALTTLVLSLATRNVVKRTVKNTRLNRTNKKSKLQFQGPLGAIYLSSTAIEAPDAEDMEADPDHPAREGVSHRPHMRRGHLHTVVHGVGRRERRVQWFPAVFVNADPAFVADARKYVVTP